MMTISIAEKIPSMRENEKLVSPVKDFFHLLKPGVMTLVVFTGAIGLWMAPVHSHPYLCFITVLSIAMGSGAAGSINMWFDADIDKIMKRTQRRPIPAGRLKKESALQFGVILASLSIALLYLATNLLAASILAFSIFFYVFIYTMWLKRSTPQNIVIGGAAGAFPPIIGWTAMTGSLSGECLLMFSIIFIWTPPHFWALSLYRSQEYAKAGIPMLPVVSGIETTKKHILGYSFILFFLTLLPTVLKFSGLIYGSAALLLGGYFLYLALKVKSTSHQKYAYHLFGYSIIYLFLLFAALIIDKLWI